MDKDLLLKYLKELEANLQELKKIKIRDVKELNTNIEKQWSILHGLQIVIQGILDIGNGILSYLGVTDIDTYREIIIKLGENKILPVDFTDDIKNIAGFRNILIHGYTSVDMEKVYFIVKNKLENIDRFIKYISEYSKKMYLESESE